MTFRISRGHVLFLLGVVFLLLLLGWNYFNGLYRLAAAVSLFLGFYLSESCELHDGVLTKSTLFFFKKRFVIKDIKLIEAVTKKKLGYIYINLTKGPTEDYYLIHFKDLTTYKLNANLYNKGQSIGRFLAKEYKIKLKEKEIMQYLYGN
ncbi:hypothetical protein [Paenibacillus sp. ATY16]|uniref:hypothetical protein n=1 Tax=Paenibacillus sp. ATY16 TaxID=1759312 RepID=UPI000E2F859D|nr:hypothetical protein [Paenibacillus sp. ATY16]MCK9859323.1 hypothetical protein [Paenibacillus sp. ATY16]